MGEAGAGDAAIDGGGEGERLGAVFEFYSCGRSPGLGGAIVDDDDLVGMLRQHERQAAGEEFGAIAGGDDDGHARW